MESVFGEPPPSNGFSDSVCDFMAQEAQLTSQKIIENTPSSTHIGGTGETQTVDVSPKENSKRTATASCKVVLGKFSDAVCDFMAQEAQLTSQEISENTPSLTHIGGTGEAQMVDVSRKENSKRTATASCKVVLGKKVFDLVLANQLAKGDVLSVAKIAGISGAKHTSSLIPLCHNITLSHVRVDLMLNSKDFSVDIEGEAVSTGKTGVEMEAMTTVSVAGLTVYDMCKAASKDIQITDVRLDRKTGGKSGDWCREEE